jgi:rhodanese-related sulfurtransferase
MNFNLSQIIVILLVIVLIIFLYRYAMNSPHRISSEIAKELLQNGQIDLVLDVRTNLERNTLGYYPGSVHIPSSDLEKRMSSEYPNKNINILAYCNSGQRARIATEKLHELGYNNSAYIASTYGTLL